MIDKRAYKKLNGGLNPLSIKLLQGIFTNPCYKAHLF